MRIRKGSKFRDGNNEKWIVQKITNVKLKRYQLKSDKGLIMYCDSWPLKYQMLRIKEG